MVSFEQWLDCYMPNRLHDKFALFSLDDMRKAYEAETHADVHTDNSKVIEELQKKITELEKDNEWLSNVNLEQDEQLLKCYKQINAMKPYLVDACEICRHKNETCTDCGVDNEKWEWQE